MPRYFAFLRAINVGGRTVPMTRLKELFAAEGVTDVASYLASGNLTFRSRSTSPLALAKRLERAMYQALKYEVATFLRTDDELLAAHVHAPYSKHEMAEAHTLCIGFMAQPLGLESKARLRALCNDVDRYHANGRELYHLSRGGLANSTVTGKALEKALGQPVTMRNAKTVAKLVAVVRGES